MKNVKKIAAQIIATKSNVKVIFDNGNSLQTTINVDLEGAKKYYLGKTFNLGNGEHDLMAKAIKVELV
jgi:hypothetical protein